MDHRQRARPRRDEHLPRLADPKELRHIPLFRELDDATAISLTDKLVTETVASGDTIVHEGESSSDFYLIARGKVGVSAQSPYGLEQQVAVLGEGDYFGEIALLEDKPRVATVKALTTCVVLKLTRAEFQKLLEANPELRATLKSEMEVRLEQRERYANAYGEQKIDVASGHEGEPNLPESYVNYQEDPIEIELSLVQAIVRIHTRITDLYNKPIDQLREQIRLTVETIKERQEWELINNAKFGFLSAAASPMRVQTRTGPPTPDDLDELIARVWKEPAFFLAHPQAIAAFGRECTLRGVPPVIMEAFGNSFLTWRGLPIVPCDKLGIQRSTTNILLLRVGEEKQGVIGLHQPGIPDEIMPGLTIRSMGINSHSVASYLLSQYFASAVLVDDALGVLENVEVGHYPTYK